MFGLFKRSDQIALLDEMIAEKFVQLRAMRRAASEVSMPDENGYCRVCGGSDSEAAEHKAKLVDLMAKREPSTRRERIATAALSGFITAAYPDVSRADAFAMASVKFADALIAALDEVKA